MTYSEEEYSFLCILFAAARDGMQGHEGLEDLADSFDSLGKAIFREEELSVSMLKAIKKALVYSIFLFDREAPDAEDEVIDSLHDLRQKALRRTIAMLKERGVE